MKIYTKTGDSGSTGIIGQGRLLKSDERIEAYGSVDELNAAIGMLRFHVQADDLLYAPLKRIQNQLFELGSALATEDPEALGLSFGDMSYLTVLEDEIDRMEKELKPLSQFILPGGTRNTSWAHMCRVICRRAERRVVALHHLRPQSDVSLAYLNRLADWFFVAARYFNHLENQPDELWQR